MITELEGIVQVEITPGTIDETTESRILRLSESGRVMRFHDPSAFILGLLFFLLGIAWQEIRSAIEKRRAVDSPSRTEIQIRIIEEVEIRAKQYFFDDAGITQEEAAGRALLEVMQTKGIKITMCPQNDDERTILRESRELYDYVIVVEE